jgi:hypothetical protein
MYAYDWVFGKSCGGRDYVYSHTPEIPNQPYDWTAKRQRTVIGSLFLVNAVMLIVFAGFLKWIQYLYGSIQSV